MARGGVRSSNRFIELAIIAHRGGGERAATVCSQGKRK